MTFISSKDHRGNGECGQARVVSVGSQQNFRSRKVDPKDQAWPLGPIVDVCLVLPSMVICGIARSIAALMRCLS